MDYCPEKDGLCYIAGFLYIILIVRNVLEVKKNTNSKSVSLTTIIATAIAIPAIPAFFTVFCVFLLYRLFIEIILKIKHGARFGGILSGSDAFHIVGDSSNGISISCFIVRSKKYTPQEFFELSKNLVAKCFGFPKFNSIFLKSYGYSYMLKKSLDFNECVVKMNTSGSGKNKITKEELHKLLTEHYNEPMPRNGEIPWQVLIGTQPIKWKEDDYDYFPVMFRIHHSIADGITLIKLFIGIIADKQEDDEFEKKQKDSNKYSLFKMIKSVIGSVAMICYLFYLLPASMVVFFLYRAKDVNILHSRSLTNQKILGSSAEENKEYVDKIKRIKNKFPEVTFSTVLLTAFSASLDDYYKKNCPNPPQHITATIPVLTGSPDMRQLVPGKLDLKEIKVENTYSVLLMNLPISIGNDCKFLPDRPLISRLKLVHRESNTLKNSTDYQVNYLVIKILFATLPLPLLEIILKSVRCTTAISILPGPPKITYDNGFLVLSDLIPWVPHLHNIATSFGIITYDDRLQIGLSADTAVVPSQKDAQVIVDNVYTFLDMLEKETQVCCTF